jgi:serine/threonine-protein kinase
MEVILRVTSGPHKGEERLIQGEGTLVVGRSSQVKFSMPEDRLLSREHFRIEVEPPICRLKDLRSTNGTKVNGLRVETAPLEDGDMITAGESEFVLQLEMTTFNSAARPRCRGCGREVKTIETAGGICASCLSNSARYPKTGADFLIERRIGGGGMGEVYLARQLSLHRPVAIKMMMATGNAPEKAKDYFRREMLVLKDLLMPNGRGHPNIVTFYDIHEIDGQFQLIMEYVGGKNALEWAASLSGGTRTTSSDGFSHDDSSTGTFTQLPIGTVARIGKLMLAGLEYAHSKGYVHRDVKPSNLLVMGPPQHPKVKLSDFGLAKSFKENTGFAPLTHQGEIGGSVGFLSPEHIRDFRNMKAAADIYSAAVTLYFLLTRRYPYLGFNPNRAEAYTMILEHPPVPLRIHRPEAPMGLDHVLRKAMEKDPMDRWKSAKEMAEALKPFVDFTS